MYVDVVARFWITGALKDPATADKLATDFGFAQGPFATGDSVSRRVLAYILLSAFALCIRTVSVHWHKRTSGYVCNMYIATS